MTAAPFRVKRLEKEDRASFECGKDELDRYFRKQIGQDIRRQVTTGFIALHETTGTIAGFYTLSATHVPFTDLNDDWRRKLPAYSTLPAVLVGRLAVDRRFRRRSLGSALLADAAMRAVQSDIAARFLVVDALDEDAVLFYQHHGFRRVPGNENRLFIPLSLLEKLISG